MEPRSALAEYDADTGRYTVHAGSGGAVRQKREIAAVLGVEPDRVRVHAYDVGGNFGTRNRCYVEFPLVAWASRRLGRPVKCTVERSEALVSDYQGRDLVTEVALAFDKDGTILGLRGGSLSNVGARCASLSPLSKGSGIVTGSYRVPVAWLRSRATFSNTPPTNAYRSSGRPECIFAIERLIEAAAIELGIDAVELRRRNLVGAEEMPYRNAVGMTYDSGEYEKSLDMSIGLSDPDGFAARKEAAARDRLLGRGLAHYVESSIGTPVEQTRIRVFGHDRRVDVVIGTQPSGQGHETSFAQVAAERFGVRLDEVCVVMGDTDIVKVGGGSHSGRSMRMAGTVIVKGVDALVEKAKPVAAGLLEAAEIDVAFADGCFAVAGTDRSVALYDVAAAADGRVLGIVADNEMHTPVFTNGCHVCEVEVDPETGEVEIVRYAAVDDVGRAVGRAINPLIVDGQTHGGNRPGGRPGYVGGLRQRFREPAAARGLVHGLRPAARRPFPVLRDRAQRGPLAHQPARRQGRWRRRYHAGAGGDRQCHRGRAWAARRRRSYDAGDPVRGVERDPGRPRRLNDLAWRGGPCNGLRTA